ncbi:hypothetical protein NQZ68_000555 [Dissostichus eleginoides]|nr:hypothetical protein NQZ68_000555 [Dissostichus eleginoides]
MEQSGRGQKSGRVKEGKKRRLRTVTKEGDRVRKWQPDEHKNERDNQERSEIDRGIGGGSWSGDQTTRRDHLTGDEKKEVMRSQMAQVNRGGDEFRGGVEVMR